MNCEAEGFVFSAGGVHGQGAQIPHASWPKGQSETETVL